MSLYLPRFGAKLVKPIKLLWEDDERVVYRALRDEIDSHPQPVIVVTSAAEHPTSTSIDRLAHEYSLKDDLDAPWAVRPLDLLREHGRTILMLDDPGGDLLYRLIGAPMALSTFLLLAEALAAALRGLHERGLIHRNINPLNILVNDSMSQVRLTGFGVTSRLLRERQAPAPPEFIAGTLSFMAPEQTGRMNRYIDSRSDLYSLGVTFYQMLTGRLPFTASDPMEWVHCHIARAPVPPREQLATIPEPISQLVMKLLAKNAEDRYQTAAGLEADLRRCLAEWQSHGCIDPFPLGTDDALDRLVLPEKLYGREHEVEALLAAFGRVVAQGTTELVLVSGYSGVGKSSVVNELHKVLVPSRGLFAVAKFDQYKRDIPYATLAQAFQMLVRQILVKSEAEVGHWRHALLEALGPNGQLMVNLIPEVEFVIGKQPPVPDLPPREAGNRFQLVFQRFLGAFAAPEHPLALFLDDLQWLDTATLELLEHLVTDPDMRHVLLIGAYRDNEVSSSHPLMRTLAAIRETGAITQEIVLSPLGIDDVHQLIAGALRCGRKMVGPLAQLIHEKTGGNPFFAIQFLTELAEEGLLLFDGDAAGWICNLGQVRAKGYTDSVVDLMVGKLRRLPDDTQIALQQLACLGNVAEIPTLSMILGQSEEEIHAALLEAARAGLILRLEESYAFLHDRIQEAAYALIPKSACALAHLRIGRALLASLTADGLTKHLFDVANQLNRGAELLIDHDEKVRAAAIDLRAGRKAKASAAYASAHTYFAAGSALLTESDWNGQYELMFGLWLECAECEFLTGQFDGAEQLIVELLRRAASKVELAAVYHLKIRIHTIKSEYQQAVTVALTCLRQLGIDMPANPTEEQVQAESETLWQILDRRPIESLIDRPLMTDPELAAAAQIQLSLSAPAYFTGSRLHRLHVCRMVTISLQHGVSMNSPSAYSSWSIIVGRIFKRYEEGYRFAKLARALVEKHGFFASQVNAQIWLAGSAMWSRPISTAIEHFRAGSRSATEMGDPILACISAYQAIALQLLRNDPLDLVWRETERALDFARKVKSGDATKIITGQQHFITTMQGRTAHFPTLSEAQLDEATARGQHIIWYWILRLKAQLMLGEYADALVAAGKAKALLPATAFNITLLDHIYYSSLAMAALYQGASQDERQAWRELLAAHQEQLREWAENLPSTFDDKYKLVSAEIARLEKRDADALRLYEQAIHSARENGFIQNEGLAHELAAQFCLTLGLETAGYAHLRNARNCYDRWGAAGKIKQLDARHPRLRQERTSTSAAVAEAAAQLDVESVVKASQALSSEILLPTLIEKLLRIAVENAGAERGLLILIRDGEPQIEAEATTSRGGIEVFVQRKPVAPSDLPQSALLYVVRTRGSVLLDDASSDRVYSKDEYVRQKRSRSVLCLPIVKQSKLVGALYLENNLAPFVFTPDRVAVLKLLASQAAISLENAALYTDLQLQVGLLQRLPVSAWTLKPDGTPDFVNHVWLEFAGQSADFVQSHPEAWMTAIHPDDRETAAEGFWEGVHSGQDFAMEYRSLRTRDGVYRWLLSQAVVLRDSGGQILKFVGTTTDIDDQKRAEDALRRAQGDLARINRVTTMGELAASLAHEINQPIGGAVLNASACLRWLGSDKPDLDEVRLAVTRMLRDTQRAAEIVARIRSQFEKGTPNREFIDVNEIIQETVTLLRSEAMRYNISARTELVADLPHIVGDRVQLQQVAMNLIVNSIEAMKDVDGEREITIKSRRGENGHVLLSFCDTGTGFPPQLAEQMFDAFYTTKPHGTGMGLRIGRSIIEAHDGRMWAENAAGRGAAFHLSLPAAIFPS